MDYTGHIIKMDTKDSSPIEYRLMFGEKSVIMNDLIKKYIILKYENEISCIGCGRITNKSFAQGFCYPCFLNSPLISECIMRPERCKAHQYPDTPSQCTTRDLEWAQNNCLQKQYVYLAISSGLKVGVTRNGQIPTRWIDQGAVEAIKFATTPNRYLSGLIEVALKEYVSDKTSWQKMLKNDVNYQDLKNMKYILNDKLSQDLQNYLHPDDTIYKLDYPVETYPLKIKSVNFDKEQVIEGRLWGIKGQYLMFDDGRVFNIRRHNGYLTTLEI
tara:strand:- start:746 stop:1561 length:816 start_codon:yes stop_codon:yes gene_type:complete